MCPHPKPNSRKTPRARAARLAALLFGFLAAGTVHSAAPPANTPIGKTAEVTYFNTSLGLFEILQTNNVEARVAATPRLSVSEAEYLKLPAASSGSHIFQATNTGNIDLDIRFSTSQLGDDAFDVLGALYLDLNNNGVVDTNDLTLDPDTPLRLDAGSTASLIYQFGVPSDVNRDDISVVEFTATATTVDVQEPPLVLNRQASTMIVDGTLNLFKSAQLRPSDQEIDYTIAARNTALSAIATYDDINEMPLEVDGNPQSAIVIRDEIPLNTTFVAFRDSADLLPVYHIRGQAEHSYVTIPPPQLSEIDAVAFWRQHDPISVERRRHPVDGQ